ncbi:MAG: hypothetical protein OEW23_19885 [Candidatus Aminicenantes bacterium]|nr:hypothetical protein [Candidatus Aminicenantes bacterium]
MLKSRIRCLVGAVILPFVFWGFTCLSFTYSGFACSGFAQDSTDYSLQEALKVINLIEKIQLEQFEKGSGVIRNVVVTESEFNSYVAYRIDVEKEEVMKELRLRVFDDNKIEGKLVVDLREQKLPKILKPRMTFYMGGKLEVKDGNIRLNLDDLFLENQRIQPAVLDLAIFIGSKIAGGDSFNISDWWVLPHGIKDVKTQKGKLTFYY